MSKAIVISINGNQKKIDEGTQVRDITPLDKGVYLNDREVTYCQYITLKIGDRINHYPLPRTKEVKTFNVLIDDSVGGVIVKEVREGTMLKEITPPNVIVTLNGIKVEEEYLVRLHTNDYIQFTPITDKMGVKTEEIESIGILITEGDKALTAKRITKGTRLYDVVPKDIIVHLNGIEMITMIGDNNPILCEGDIVRFVPTKDIETEDIKIESSKTEVKGSVLAQMTDDTGVRMEIAEVKDTIDTYKDWSSGSGIKSNINKLGMALLYEIDQNTLLRAIIVEMEKNKEDKKE